MKILNKVLAVILTSMLVLGSTVATSVAETLPTIDFETYTLGQIDGQDGWNSDGAAGTGCATYDHEFSGSFGTTGFEEQSLRISNAVTSGCFGDQTFAKPLTDSVGETAATTGGFSEGTRQQHFEVEFDIASTVPEAQQEGLFVSVSPDRGDGSRMSYLGFEDTSDGLNIIFYDVQGNSNPANFVLTDLGNFDRTTPHKIKLTMDTIDSDSNDVVKVYIDGSLAHTGTSWENYYRFDTEASAEQSPRIVKTLIFRTGGSAAPSNDGNGFLFDNLSMISGPIPVDPFAVPEQCSAIDELGEPIVGTEGSEKITGTPGNDLIFGLGGSDKIDGKGGDDCIVGGDGSDKLIGGTGNDVLLGGAGSDSLEGGNDNDKLYGEEDSDSLKGGSGNDMLFGGDNSDSLKGDGGNDVLEGGDGSDSLKGGAGNDELTGDDGVDSAHGDGGTDTCTAESVKSCEL